MEQSKSKTPMPNPMYDNHRDDLFVPVCRSGVICLKLSGTDDFINDIFFEMENNRCVQDLRK